MTDQEHLSRSEVSGCRVVLRWERELGFCVRTQLPGGVCADQPVSIWRALPKFASEIRWVRRMIREGEIQTEASGSCGLSGCSNDREWELAADRDLDELTDDQLRYLHAAIEGSLDDRGWYRTGESGQPWRKDADA